MTVQIDPYTFSNGTVADALEVNARFNPLYTLQNGGIDSTNMNLSANFPWTGLHTFISTTTTGNAVAITASSLTTGTALTVLSNSTDTSTRSLVSIKNDNTLATGATVVTLTQDAAATPILNLIGSAGTSIINFLSNGTIALTGTPNITGSVAFDTDTLFVDSSNNRVGFGTASPSFDLDLSRSTSGGTVLTRIRNTSNTASSDAVLVLDVAGSSAGDAYINFNVASVQAFSFGIDNSASPSDTIWLNPGSTLNAAGIGFGMNPSGSVFITNTSAPPLTMDRTTTGSIFGDITGKISGTAKYYLGTNASDNFAVLNANATVAMSISTSTNAGDVTCNALLYVPNHATTASAANAFIDSGTGEILRSTSSLRYKDNVTDLDFDSSGIYNLRPVSFNEKNTDKKHFGLIAEEVASIIPMMTEYNSHGDPESVQYALLGVLLLAEVKKLKQRLDDLEGV